MQMFYDCTQSLEVAQVTDHGKMTGTAAVGSGFCQLAAVNSPLETRQNLMVSIQKMPGSEMRYTIFAVTLNFE